MSDTLEIDDGDNDVNKCWAIFEQAVPDENCAREIVLNKLNEHAQCPECHNVNNKKKSNRKSHCEKCLAHWSVTTGTLFSSAKKFRVYLAILFFHERRIVVSGNQISKLLKISTSSAWLALKKVQWLICNAIKESEIVMETGLLQDLFLRRSTQTPAEHHPREEENLFQTKHLELQNTDTEDLITCSEEEKTILELLKIEPLSLEGLLRKSELPRDTLLSALSMLEISQRITRKNDQMFARHRQASKRKTLKQMPPAVRLTVNELHAKIHGFSRKYAEMWVGAFRNCFAQEWPDDFLLNLSLTFGPITRRQITRFVSADMVPFFKVCNLNT